MFRGGREQRQGENTGRRVRRLLVGALGLTAACWLLPIRIGVVSGHSMDPTLRTGQVLAVDRGYYRGGSPMVGDVVLFRGESGVYVKRVYAVAGQTVSLLEQGEGEDVERLPVARTAERRIAARLTGVHSTRLCRVPVPEGTFFALGDAVHNSEDSRDFGPVPVEKIIGRVLPIGATLAAPDNECHDIADLHVAGMRLIAAL
jgi:signal peptidase I